MSKTTDTMDEENAILQVENLTKRFGSLVAVDSVSFAVPEGQFQGLIGPNGAGKSTLFNMINGFYDPTEGSVSLRGETITDLEPHERCQRGIARSFQIVDTFASLTVRENVQLATQAMSDDRYHPLKDADSLTEVNERTEAVLEEVGLETVAGLPVHELSYGDQRILELALALASDPDVLLLDEPTAGLGVDASQEMEQLISDVAADKTVLLTEHDVEMIMNVCDEILVLHEGKLIAEGTPSEIVDNERVQSAYLGGQA
jgi:branched-chain amino acid transport system ATP-binding protein